MDNKDRMEHIIYLINKYEKELDVETKTYLLETQRKINEAMCEGTIEEFKQKNRIINEPDTRGPRATLYINRIKSILKE